VADRSNDRMSHRAVAATAVVLGAARLAVIAATGPTARGLDSDESIYVTAGLALGRGALPYRDVTVAQPPGLFVLLAPLGQLRSVLDAITVARIGSALAGAFAAYLIGRIALRQYATAAAIAAMVIAATLPAVAVAERSVLIEPWLNLFTLLAAACWLATPTDDHRDRRSAWAAGVALGAALTFKFWAIGLLVPIIATRAHRSWRDLGRVLGGAAATFALVVIPFVAASPSGFVEQTIGYQSGRTDGTALHDRLRGVFGLGWDQLAWREAVPTLVAALAVVLLCTRRRSDPVLRFGVAWYVTTVAAFLVGPYFGFHYAAALAPAVGLMAAAVVAEALTLVATPDLRPRTAGIAAIALLALGVTNDLRWVRGDALGRAPAVESFAVDLRDEPGTVWSPSPERILVGDRLPGSDGDRRLQLDPFAATAPGASRADGVAAARTLVERSDLVVLGPDDEPLERVLRQSGFVQIRRDTATGSSLWHRPDGASGGG
jgi:hypothetical protein